MLTDLCIGCVRCVYCAISGSAPVAWLGGAHAVARAASCAPSAPAQPHSHTHTPHCTRLALHRQPADKSLDQFLLKGSRDGGMEYHHHTNRVITIEYSENVHPSVRPILFCTRRYVGLYCSLNLQGVPLNYQDGWDLVSL